MGSSYFSTAMREELRQAFECNFAEGVENGAAVCVMQRGRELCHLYAGMARPGIAWAESTLVPVFSATKPAAAACLLQAMWERGFSPMLELGELWPEFPLPRATVGQLLSHQCGLAALVEPVAWADAAAWCSAIERTCPAWCPPEHGYHPQTFGPLVEVLMRRVCGMSISDFWEQRIRRPLQLDFYIGHVPESAFERIAYLQAPRLPRGGMPRDAFYQEYFNPGSSIYRAFHSVTGQESAREMNTPSAWNTANPARGGVASARGLAGFYQLLPGEGESPFALKVRQWLGTPQCRGLDKTLLQSTAFTCGAMCEPLSLFPQGSYGHAGAGGCHALVHPGSGLSFAYVMNRMQLGVLPTQRVLRLLSAVFPEPA